MSRSISSTTWFKKVNIPQEDLDLYVGITVPENGICGPVASSTCPFCPTKNGAVHTGERTNGNGHDQIPVMCPEPDNSVLTAKWRQGSS